MNTTENTQIDLEIIKRPHAIHVTPTSERGEDCLGGWAGKVGRFNFVTGHFAFSYEDEAEVMTAIYDHGVVASLTI